MRRATGFLVSVLLAGAIVAIYIMLYAAISFVLSGLPHKSAPVSPVGYLLIVVIASAIGGFVAAAILMLPFSLLARVGRLTPLRAVILGLALCLVWYSCIGPICASLGWTDPAFLPFSLKAALQESGPFVISIVVVHAISLSLLLARFAFSIPVYRRVV